MAKTLFDKLWDEHVVADLGDDNALLYIDRVFLHERTGSVALKSLQESGRTVRFPEHVFGVMDHIVDTVVGRNDNTQMPSGKKFISAMRDGCSWAGIKLFDVNDDDQGIVHVISPEKAIILPGLTLVCPDSHTCSQGAFGALAWGIGSTEAEHALATSTLRTLKPKTMRITIVGKADNSVSAKDIILAVIAQLGANGAANYAIEFAGTAVDAMDMEARMTLCNMAVELSAFTAVIAPDSKTLSYLKGAKYAPTGAAWEKAATEWRTLRSDPGAVFDLTLEINASHIKTMVSWGTSPEQAVNVTSQIPAPQSTDDEQALAYMDLVPATWLSDIKLDAAFIGSCTNGRLSDLRAAAAVLRGSRIKKDLRAICVPGSMAVKAAAEAEGLDKIFTAAGFEWRLPGCSMCFYAGGESFGPNARVISTTNRNFENRQGPGTRTHIASPATVAASAIAGTICGPNDLGSAPGTAQ